MRRGTRKRRSTARTTKRKLSSTSESKIGSATLPSSVYDPKQPSVSVTTPFTALEVKKLLRFLRRRSH